MKCCIALLLLASPHISLGSEKVIVYTQYDSPPFWSADSGLSHELVRELSARSKNRYQFEIQITPRKRIDLILEDPHWQGLIPWSSPSWFQDANQQRYLWSAPLFRDADLVISHAPLDYTGPYSLHGKVLGGILGHRYSELEADIAAGKIIRDDAPNQPSNLKKLRSQRVDVIFIPNSSWGELRLKSPEQIRSLWVASQVRNTYERRILLSPNNPELARYVQATVLDLAKDQKWQQKIAPYHFSNQAAH
ncbi:transporter substrate-binding domain-containing protein [Chitinibacter sp. FCG-7]|uniref:Transporter substrate-binding domain-containing protein n=1 Tax=Chitinibacter mangrovi TaxID=3153927 RepID=A0AAU7FCK4_9NEIS